MWGPFSKRPGPGAWALLLALWLSLASSFGFAEVVLTDQEYLIIEQELLNSNEALQRAEETLKKQSVLLEKQNLIVKEWLPSLDSFNLNLKASTDKAASLVTISAAQEKRLNNLSTKIEGLLPTFDRLDQVSEKLSMYYERLEFELWLWRGATAGTLGLLLLAILSRK